MESKKSLRPPARSEGTDNKRWKLSLKNRRGKKKRRKTATRRDKRKAREKKETHPRGKYTSRNDRKLTHPTVQDCPEQRCVTSDARKEKRREEGKREDSCGAIAENCKVIYIARRKQR